MELSMKQTALLTSYFGICSFLCGFVAENKKVTSNVHQKFRFVSSDSGQEIENPDSSGGGEESVLRIEERENEGEKKREEGKLAIVVFLVGIWVIFKQRLEKIWLSGWLSWWPWQQEKRLHRLIAEADANPTDAALQSSLLAELNKHSPESVIKRFEQRDLVVDSRGVIEYLRVLVATNAIADYLPDEQSGKPSSLPTLDTMNMMCVAEGADPRYEQYVTTSGMFWGKLSTKEVDKQMINVQNKKLS